MESEGQLRTYGNRVTDVGAFLQDVFAEIGGRVAVLGCDRYRAQETMQAIEAAGLRVPLRWRGTGASRTADGSHDVRAFQRAVIRRELLVERCHMWRSALRYATLRFDAAGNPALLKVRDRGRIDAIQAAVIACGLAALQPVRRPLRIAVASRR